MGSYRQIALTSTIGKVLERLIANRLSWWLEERSALSPWQAGFRMRRSTTDQCLWLSQFITDGLQSTQRRRSIGTLFDLSLAYDRVWRTGLLMKMSKMGVPSRFTEWLTFWFINRIARVLVNGAICPFRTIKESLPLVSVHSPLLFTIYVDDLLAEFERDTFVRAYADDLLIAHSARNKDMIVASMQPEVDKVVAWSKKARLTLSTFKCETAFISLDCADSAWQANITIDGKRMFGNPIPFFLDFRYHRMLTFAEHVRKLCQSMSSGFNLHRALGGTTWGWHASDCRKIYIAIVRSMLKYAAAAWEPWLLATSTSKLENVQLEAARAISGLVRFTPVETVLAEFQPPPIATRFQAIYLIKADEWVHLPPTVDRRQAIFPACRQRLNKKDWRNALFLCQNQLGLKPRF